MKLVLRPFDLEVLLLRLGRALERITPERLVPEAQLQLVAKQLADEHANHEPDHCILCAIETGNDVPRARTFRVVETDNFGRDYPNEEFASPHVSKAAAEKIAEILNIESSGPNADRFFKVVPEDYKLAPGFES